MAAGQLKLTIKTVKGFHNLEKSTKYSLRVSAGKNTQSTVQHSLDKEELNEILIFDLPDKNAPNLFVEFMKEGEMKALSTVKEPLNRFLRVSSDYETKKEGDRKKSSDKTSQSSPPSTATSSSGKSESTTSASVPRSLSTTNDETKLWFIHPSFYYTKTKEVYSFAKSFSAIAYVATYGEVTVEYLLKKISPKTSSLGDVDDSLSPVLTKVDSKVDEKVAYLLKTLTASQDYIIATKDGAIHKVYDTVNSTKSTLSSTVTSAQAKVSGATHAAVETACNVRDLTVNKISSASNSTYSSLANATNKILAYVPLISKKDSA